MNWKKLSRLPKKDLLALFDVSLKSFRTADGLWFTGVEDRFGNKPAVDIDIYVWEKLGTREAFRLKRALGIEDDGVAALVRALELAPSFSMIDYEIFQTSPTQALFRCTSCYSQKERLKAGRGLFDCRGVDQSYFDSFAQTINPKFRVECNFGPPEKYYEDLWCEWRFELEDSEGGG